MIRNLNPANLLTLSAVAAGGFCLILLQLDQLRWVYLLFPLIPLLDKLDGAVARRYNYATPLGAQLDSLADVLNFGMLAGVLLVVHAKAGDSPGYRVELICIPAALLFVMCAAWRLARFNSEEKQALGFSGLPTTNAAAWLFIACVASLWLGPGARVIGLSAVAIVLAGLMVGRFNYSQSNPLTLVLYPLLPTAGIAAFVSS